jgi:hypothetical protein
MTILILALISLQSQSTTYTTDAGGTNYMIPTSRTELADSLQGAVVTTWKYDPDSKNVTLKLQNISGKVITAYSVSVTITFSDGSTDALPDGRASSERLEESLSSLIQMELAKGTPDEERMRDYDRTFAAGSIRYDVLPQLKDVSNVKAVADTVIYADGTADVQNERAFHQVMAMRKGQLLGMQKVNEVLKQIIDSSVEEPIRAAVEELTRLSIAEEGKPQDPENPNQDMEFRNTISDLRNAQRASKAMKLTEREYLQKLVKDNDARIALTLPHTQIISRQASNTIQ